MRNCFDRGEEVRREEWMQSVCDEDLEERVTAFTEEDGFGEWVEGRDPKAPCVYCVRGTAVKDGVEVSFEDKVEYCFRAVNCKAEDESFVDDFGREQDTGNVYTEYDVEGFWDTCYLEEEGYTDVKVLAWKQDE